MSFYSDFPDKETVAQRILFTSMPKVTHHCEESNLFIDRNCQLFPNLLFLQLVVELLTFSWAHSDPGKKDYISQTAL